MQTGTIRTLIGLLILAGVVFVLHTRGMEQHLYWYFWWYDIMMHFLCGFCVGGVFAWITFRAKPDVSRRNLIIVILVAIAIIGVGWEIFEYLTDQYVGQANIVVDTIKDLINDTLGALTAAWLITTIGRRRTSEML